jgi:hypothetical protein
VIQVVQGNTNLEEHDHPECAYEEECDEGGYLVFDVVAELNEAQWEDKCQCDEIAKADKDVVREYTKTTFWDGAH